MALADELTALVEHAGRGVLDDATSFGAALDDYLAPEVASRGVLNLLVDAVRQGALDRLLRDIEHGADPARAVAASGDQLARDRASSESGSSRWAVAVLGYAAGAVDRRVVDAQAPPEAAGPPIPAPSPHPPVASPPSSVPPNVPPTLPPTARPAVPPVAAPPVAAPPQWAPAPAGRPGRPAQQPPRRRTGLVVAGVVLAVVVIAGAVVTAVVLGSDDPKARTVDDPTSAVVTSEGTASDTASGQSSDGTSPGADPAEIAELLTGIAADSFPAGDAPPAVTAQSWSVEASNTPEGYPRDLDETEWDRATSWTVRDQQGASRFNITVTHIPDDAERWFVTDCSTFTSNEESEVECREFETSDGRAGIEYWFRHATAGIASHQVVLAGDLATGTPQVTVGERLEDPAENLTLAQAKAKFLKTEDDLRSIAVNSRLVLPRPAETPPLPSYDYCISTTPKPEECPAGLI